MHCVRLLYSIKNLFPLTDPPTGCGHPPGLSAGTLSSRLGNHHRPFIQWLRPRAPPQSLHVTWHGAGRRWRQRGDAAAAAGGAVAGGGDAAATEGGGALQGEGGAVPQAEQRQRWRQGQERQGEPVGQVDEPDQSLDRVLTCITIPGDLLDFKKASIKIIDQKSLQNHWWLSHCVTLCRLGGGVGAGSWSSVLSPHWPHRIPSTN